MSDEVLSLLLDESRSWDERIYRMNGWEGVCDQCGVEVKYDGLIPCVRFPQADTPTMDLLFPLIGLRCPSCRGAIGVIRRWKSLDITAELEELKHVG